MRHIAIDLGAQSSQLCIRDAGGEILQETKIPTAQLGRRLKKLSPGRVVVEACTQAFKIADQARAAGHEVVVVPSVLSPTLGVGQRGIKTDQRDAQALSLASCMVVKLPSVHVPDVLTRDLRSELTARSQLVKARKGFINSLRGIVRGRLVRPKSGSPDTFAERMRAALLETPEGVPEYLEPLLEMVEVLTERIKAATQALEERSKSLAICRQLRTIPGVGLLTSLHFAASIDDIKRFKNAHAVSAYLGLTPGEHSSGAQKKTTGITKAGHVDTRSHLVQAAWTLWRTQPQDPAVLWCKRIAERRGKKVAIVALARKLAGILYALWRDNSSYNATRSAQAIEVTPDA